MSQLFKNIGLKFFKKQHSDDVVDEIIEDDELIPTVNNQYHIEFIDYKKTNFIKLWFLKNFCMHDWAVYNRTNVMGDGDIPVRIDHTLICRKCGKINKITL